MGRFMNTIYQYRRSWIILAAIALKFYIMNPPTDFYKNGTALVWLIFSLSLFVSYSERCLSVICGFTALMLYTLIDNSFFSIKQFEPNDIYFISCIATTSIVYHYTRARDAFASDRLRATVNNTLLLSLAALLIAGRNYIPICELLRLQYDPVAGTGWYLSDATGFVVAAIYTLYNSRGVNRITAVFFLLLALHNLLDDAFFDPVHTRLSEWGIIIYIALVIAWLLPRYLYRNNRAKVSLLNKLALTFHVYLVVTILCLFIYLAGNALLSIRLISIFLLVLLTTWVLAIKLWMTRPPHGG